MAPSPADLLVPGKPLTLAGVADGAEGFVLADLARAAAARAQPAASLLVICRDGPRMAALSRALAFFAPEIEIIEFPAWDCLPYDRVSPHQAVVAERMAALARLARPDPGSRPAVILTTVNAVLQRVPSRTTIASQWFSAAPGNLLRMDDVMRWLELNGFLRGSTVREPGEYAVRGGILDLFAPGMEVPVRLDFFGDTLESIRSFDPETQRTSGQLRKLALVAVTEFQVTPETIARFRKEYLARFGAARRDDLLYEAVSEGRRHPGMEHWLPLFHERLETLFDYVPGASIVLEPLVDDAANERLTQIADYYEARKEPLDSAAPPYHPLPPDCLYLAEREWRGRLDDGAVARLTPFSQPDASSRTVEIGARQGRNFAAERAEPNANVYDAVRTHVLALQGAGKRVAIALWSEGARERMSHVLADHGLLNLTDVQSWPDALAKPKPDVALAVLGLESGFETDASAIISEQDILGDRLVRPRRASRRAEHFIAEVTSLTPGDLVVHVDHGIGRFAGLTNIEAAGAPHDCLEVHYAGGDKLYLPVENIELLSRYGAEET
ncbi:MAG TPA: CarD family transcriptional regulator, partial [Xanthobacteraceae bacterium]|nr:CarD family transcriptional regulator [Xanthobacteraceae bacterium]